MDNKLVAASFVLKLTKPNFYSPTVTIFGGYWYLDFHTLRHILVISPYLDKFSLNSSSVTVPLTFLIYILVLSLRETVFNLNFNFLYYFVYAKST